MWLGEHVTILICLYFPKSSQREGWKECPTRTKISCHTAASLTIFTWSSVVHSWPRLNWNDLHGSFLKRCGKVSYVDIDMLRYCLPFSILKTVTAYRRYSHSVSWKLASNLPSASSPQRHKLAQQTPSALSLFIWSSISAFRGEATITTDLSLELSLSTRSCK